MIRTSFQWKAWTTRVCSFGTFCSKNLGIAHFVQASWYHLHVFCHNIWKG